VRSSWRSPLGTLLAVVTFSGWAGAQSTDTCIAASERAISLHKAGKLLDARASLSTCAASSCPDVIRTSCRQRLTEITQAIPSIVFSAKDGDGRDLAAVRLTIDGARSVGSLGGGAIVLDPGEHAFRFEAEGQPPVVKRFVLLQGEQNRREQIVLGARPPPPPPPAVPSGGTNPGSATNSGSTPRLLGLVVGGLGVTALAVGGIFGALSIGAHNDYERACGPAIGAPPGECTPAGVSGEGDAATKGMISTIAFIGGGIATAGCLLLLLFTPSGTANLHAGVGLGSVVLGGQF
jgi:hypothetical protein